MAVAFVEAEESDISSSTDLVLTKPTDIAAGDFLLAIGTITTANPLSTLPTGWTRVFENMHVLSTSKTRFVAYKVATASEPANYTFTYNAAVNGVGLLASFRSDSGSIVPDFGVPELRQSQTSTWSITGFTSHLGGLAVAAIGAYEDTAYTGWTGLSATGWTNVVERANSTAASGILTRDAAVTADEVLATLALSSNRDADDASGLQMVLIDSNDSITPLRAKLPLVEPTGVFASSIVINAPTHVENDMLWTLLAVQSGTVTVTPPSGWTAVSDDVTQADSSGMRVVFAYKLATGSEPANYTWTLSGTTSCDGVSGAIPAGNTLAVTEGVPEIINVASAGTAKVIPSITSTEESSFSFGYVVGRSVSGWVADPDSMVKIIGLEEGSWGQMRWMIVTQHLPNAEASGTIPATFTGAVSSIANRALFQRTANPWEDVVDNDAVVSSFGAIYPLLIGGTP